MGWGVGGGDRGRWRGVGGKGGFFITSCSCICSVIPFQSFTAETVSTEGRHN